MPFRKVGADDYVSPSGRHWTGAQVRLYHATKGFKKKPKRTKEVNRCHGAGRGHPCSGGGVNVGSDAALIKRAKAVHQWARDMLTARPTWPKISKSGRLTMSGPGAKRRSKRLKVDNQGRVTYEALTPDALLADERERLLQEYWSPAARAASAAARRAGAGLQKQVGWRKTRAQAAVATQAKDLAGIATKRVADRKALLARQAAREREAKKAQKAPKAPRAAARRVNVGQAGYRKGDPWAKTRTVTRAG